MTKSAFVRARIEPKLKTKAEAILNEFGINPTQAITMLYKNVASNHAWPLEMKVPNAETRKVIKLAAKGIGITRHNSVDGYFKKICKK